MGGSGVSGLAAKHCVPCKGGVQPLAGEELRKLSSQLPDWKVIDGHHITKTYVFPDFKTALDFVNRVGAVAEAEGHHQHIAGAWRRVERKTDTHTIDGLTASAFVLAATS